MRTTEIFVEQLLIGFLVLGTLTLPFLPEMSATFEQSVSTFSRLVTGAFLVGVAYLVGMVFDRVADTLVEDLDRHNRARFALKALLARMRNEGWTRFPAPWKDPFPEDRLRIAALKAGGAVAEQMSYLRSRMRLARALAVFLPALTFALVLGLGRPPVEGAAASAVHPWLESYIADRSMWWLKSYGADRPVWWLVAIPGVCALVLIFVRWITKRADRCGWAVKAPRTDDKDLSRYARRHGYAPDAEDEKLQKSALRVAVLVSRLFWIYFIFFILKVILTIQYYCLTVVATFCVGFLPAVLSAWAWWRISRTFMLFVQGIGED